MRHILSWVHTRFHGAQCSKKKSEFSAGSNQPVDASSSGEPCRTHTELHDCWHQTMQSIDTFGIGEGSKDELRKMQKELTLLIDAQAATAMTAGEDKDKRRHLTLKRSLNGGTVKHRSFRNFMSSTVGGFLPRPSFMGTTPDLKPTEIPWALVPDDIPADSSAMSEATIKSYRTAQLPWRGHAMGAEQASKWIRTDSEYIVLEI